VQALECSRPQAARDAAGQRLLARAKPSCPTDARVGFADRRLRDAAPRAPRCAATARNLTDCRDYDVRARHCIETRKSTCLRTAPAWPRADAFARRNCIDAKNCGASLVGTTAARCPRNPTHLRGAAPDPALIRACGRHHVNKNTLSRYMLNAFRIPSPIPAACGGIAFAIGAQLPQTGRSRFSFGQRREAECVRRP
jgi:hypothetical protein